MATRRLRLPKGSRAAVRIAKLLGLSGTGTLLAALAVLSVCMIGAKEVSMAAGQSTCTVPDTTGGPGVEVFGDSTLTGVARVLPTRLAGGRVTDDVQTGRTAQQAENLLNAIPDTAPTVFVMSLAEDDVSSSRAYMARVDELMLLMSGRTVYWVTAPGKASYTAIVTKESAADPTDPEDTSGWHIVDFAAGVNQHPDWWNGHQPTRAGATNLAQVLTTQIGGDAGDPTTTSPNPSPTPTSSSTSTATRTSASSPSLSAPAASLAGTANGITVTSSTSSDSFRLVGERLTNAQTIVATGVSMGVPRRGIVIAIAAATQESKLVNLSHGPAGAYGLFQQTPPSWGTITQVQTPAYAATSFYTHLLKVPGWQGMALTDAAQAVEVSGYPDATPNGSSQRPLSWPRCSEPTPLAAARRSTFRATPTRRSPSMPPSPSSASRTASPAGPPRTHPGQMCTWHPGMERLPHRGLRLQRPHALRLGQGQRHRAALHRGHVGRPRLHPHRRQGRPRTGRHDDVRRSTTRPHRHVHRRRQAHRSPPFRRARGRSPRSTTRGTPSTTSAHFGPRPDPRCLSRTQA